MTRQVPDREDVMERLETMAQRALREAGFPMIKRSVYGTKHYHDEANTLRDALTLLREEWMGMESAPKQLHNVLLLTDGRRVVAGHFDVPYENHPGCWATNPGGWIFHPTHWRPLPPLPDREDG